MHEAQSEETEDMEGLQGFEDVLVRSIPVCICSIYSEMHVCTVARIPCAFEQELALPVYS